MGHSPRALAVAGVVLSAALTISPGIATGSPGGRMRPPDPDSGSAADRAIEVARTLRARIPAALLHSGPGAQRLLRERLARDPALRTEDLPGALEWLLPDAGRLPVRVAPGGPPCVPCRADAPGMLLDAAVSASDALTRGDAGLRIALGAIAWSRDAVTEVPAAHGVEADPLRLQQADPEFARLQVELAVALHELESSEADLRADPGSLLATLAVISDRGRVNDIHRALGATPPYRSIEPPSRAIDDVIATREIGALAATVTVSDEVTGYSETVPLAVTCERHGTSRRGTPGAVRTVAADAASLPPDARELFAIAFDAFAARAAAPVRLAAGEAARRRAAFESRRGRGAEAFGWWLLARDCGVQAPAPAALDSALAHLAEVPYAALPSIRAPRSERPERRGRAAIETARRPSPSPGSSAVRSRAGPKRRRRRVRRSPAGARAGTSPPGRPR